MRVCSKWYYARPGVVGFEQMLKLYESESIDLFNGKHLFLASLLVLS